MSTIKNLTIDRVEERTRKDNGEKFPVIIVAGVSFSVSATSQNARFTLREASIPASGMTLAQAKRYFPAGAEMEGYEIRKIETEPYEWTTPDGEVLSLSHTWDLRKVGDEAESSQPSSQEPQSSRKPVPNEVGAPEMEPPM